DTSYRADIENRDLTEEGIALALRRKKMLDNPSFDLIVSSPALRTVQTAGIVAGLGRDNITDVVPLEMLCYGNPADGGDAKTLDQLFRKLEYSPLADYLSKGKDGE